MFVPQGTTHFNSEYFTLGRNWCMMLQWFELVIKLECSLRPTKIYEWCLWIWRNSWHFQMWFGILPLIVNKKWFELLLKTPVYSLWKLKILWLPGGWGLSATGSRSEEWLDPADAGGMEAHINLGAWLICKIAALSTKVQNMSTSGPDLCPHWEEICLSQELLKAEH